MSAGADSIDACRVGAFTRKAGCSASGGAGGCGRSVGCVVSNRSMGDCVARVDFCADGLAFGAVRLVCEEFFEVVVIARGDVERERVSMPSCLEA